MLQVIGTPLVTDLDEAARLPIANPPSGSSKIRLKQSRHGRPIKFFIRTTIAGGSILRVYVATKEAGRLKLMQIVGANGHRAS